MRVGDKVRLLACEGHRPELVGQTGKIERLPLFEDGEASVEVNERVVWWPLSRVEKVGAEGNSNGTR